ncbi:MAG: cell division protein FtsZ [candidate division KSB1 bacterium]|nr:cell division protein FtsZ [candidate division KSB1 bacterium]
MERSQKGVEEFKPMVDTLIAVPNERLIQIVPKATPLNEGIRYADEILFSATKGISDLITIPGLINLDFADIVTVMHEAGDSLMGTAAIAGEERARIAAEQAITSPLLENVSISGARGLLVNITGGPDMTLHQVNDAASIIQEEAGPNANLILGAVIDPEIQDEIRITVIATGLTSEQKRHSQIALNRPKTDHSRYRTYDRREIPAIDRLDEINREKENVRKEKPQEPDPENGGNGMQKKSAFEREKELTQRNEQARITFVNSDQDSDEFNPDDLDIPACRRKRLNVLR